MKTLLAFVLGLAACHAAVEQACLDEVAEARECVMGLKEQFPWAHECYTQHCPQVEEGSNADVSGKMCVRTAMDEAIAGCGLPKKPHICRAAKQCMKEHEKADDLKVAYEACKDGVSADCKRSLKVAKCECVQAARQTIADKCGKTVDERDCADAADHSHPDSGEHHHHEAHRRRRHHHKRH